MCLPYFHGSNISSVHVKNTCSPKTLQTQKIPVTDVVQDCTSEGSVLRILNYLGEFHTWKLNNLLAIKKKKNQTNKPKKIKPLRNKGSVCGEAELCRFPRAVLVSYCTRAVLLLTMRFEAAVIELTLRWQLPWKPLFPSVLWLSHNMVASAGLFFFSAVRQSSALFWKDCCLQNMKEEQVCLWYTSLLHHICLRASACCSPFSSGTRDAPAGEKGSLQGDLKTLLGNNWPWNREPPV